MTTFTCLQSSVDENQIHYGAFLIEPLETGQGVTLGNALRRILLSELSGYGISGVRINQLKHEFTTVEGLREDILELLLNLKEILLKPSDLFREKSEFLKFQGFLNIEGPKVVTAGMFQLPKNYLKIVNPNLYLCTLVDDSELYIEIDIEKGKGYKLNEENRKERGQKNLVVSNYPSTFFVDSLFLPVKKVNFKVKLVYDTKGNIKESLILEIFTNGSLTPQRALKESCKIFLESLSCLFLTSQFLDISKNLD